MLRILTTSYNVAPYIERMITSLKGQTVTDWHCYITDDMSTDGSVPYIESLIEGDDRFTLIVNTKKHWQVGNYWQVLQREEIDDDICITIDGDDYLHNSTVFEKVLGYYEDKNIWATFGNFVYDDGSGNFKVGFSRKPEPFDVRHGPWTSSHLRTFKAHLFRKIKLEDLKDQRTNWFYKTAGDVVFLCPLIEMAGENRILYSKDLLYCYNVETELNDYKVRGSEQQTIHSIISNKPKYKRIEIIDE